MDGERFITSTKIQLDNELDLTLRPKNLSEYIGQEKVKKNLEVYINAARARGECLDHVLLYGPPGLGKTTIAHIIANEMNANIKVVSGPALSSMLDIVSILTGIEEGDILFIDEIHRVNKTVEEALYSAMEDFRLDIVQGKGPGARTLKLPVNKFTLVGATTRTGMLTGPMRDRFGVICRLEMYSLEELSTIIRRSSGILKIETDEDACEELARRSRGTPRIANRILKRVRDFAQVMGNGRIDLNITNKALSMIGVDDLGEAEGRFSIAYIPEEGMAEELATHIGEDGKLYFFVEHFSHYAVVDITPVVAVPGFAWWWILVVIGGCAVIVLIGMLLARYRRVYELNYVNGGIAPQKLRESSLIDLPLPEREDEVFDGWYYDEEFRDRALLTTMPKQNLILFAKWRRMTDEERIVRDRKRAEAAAAAAEGFHHAEPPKEELHKEEPPREIEEDE